MSVLRALLFAALEEERQKLEFRNQRRNLRDLSAPLQLPEIQFQQLYRLDRASFEELCRELSPHMSAGGRRNAISKEIKILAAISFYASGSYQKQVGADAQVALSQASLSRALEEVTEALNKREILQKYIKFPGNTQEREQIMERFMVLHNFLGVIGCIDGTHVALVRPTENEEAYFNRKHYHSLNVLVICDADLQIKYVDASYPGASHDSYVWRNSAINRHLEHLHSNGEFCWLLGDSGYPLSPWVMTPILHAEPGSPEQYYTDCLCSVRSTIERTIGVLKARWRCLLAHRTLHYGPVKAAKIVNACVVLHNICNAARLPVPELPTAERLQDLRRKIQVQGDGDQQNQRAASRENLVRRLWLARHQQ